MSAFAATLRRCAPSSSIRVSAGKKAAYARANAGKLPDEKLRALISLYHQADDFITEENLVDRINEALLGISSRVTKTSGALSSPEMPAFRTDARALHYALEKQRNAPDRAEKGTRMGPNKTGKWSLMNTERENKVYGALYGTDMNSLDEVVPGLDLLKDAAKKEAS